MYLLFRILIVFGIAIALPESGKAADARFIVSATVVAPCHMLVPSLFPQISQAQLANAGAKAISVSCADNRTAFTTSLSYSRERVLLSANEDAPEQFPDVSGFADLVDSTSLREAVTISITY